MKSATLRHTPGGLVNWKTAVGLGLVIVTILFAIVGTDGPSVTSGLLSLTIGSWTLGWVLAPIQTGAGADEPLMPAHFALLPIAPPNSHLASW